MKTSSGKSRKHPESSPFPRATLRKFIQRHAVRKKTRVSREALNLLNRLLDEVGGWIVRESEKLASVSGRSTIQSEHIRDAARQYLGWEEKE